MTQPLDRHVGLWWRFDRYEVRDGYIRPAVGATLERYHPWDDYRIGRGGGPARPPYDSLLAMLDELLRELRVSPGTPEAPYLLTKRGESAITAWCAAHGLLGILPHMAVFACIGPVWSQSRTATSLTDPMHPTSWWFTRTATGWGTTPVWMAPLDKRVDEPSPIDLQEFVWADPSLRPRVMLSDLEAGNWREEPLRETWARFFPDVPEAERDSFSYPVPDSNEFWAQYGEPLEIFVKAATMLRDGLAGMHRFQEVGRLVVGADDHRVIGRGWHQLEALVLGISPAFELGWGGKISPRWVSPSLLGSLAMMAYLDLTEGRRRPRRCEVCGRVFVSDAWAATYCSDRCRRTAQKRAYRQRQKLQDTGKLVAPEGSDVDN